MEPVQHLLTGFVSETAIEYRGSSIVADYGGEGSLRAGDRVPNPDVEFAGGKFGRLLDPLKSGRALALGIGVEDVRKIRARLPRADVVELRGAEAILGTELEAHPGSLPHEAAGYHAVSSEFPSAAAAAAAMTASAAAMFSAAGAARTYGPAPEVSPGDGCGAANAGNRSALRQRESHHRNSPRRLPRLPRQHR